MLLRRLPRDAYIAGYARSYVPHVVCPKLLQSCLMHAGVRFVKSQHPAADNCWQCLIDDIRMQADWHG